MYAFLNRMLLPHLVFWVVLGAGWYLAELSYRQIGIALVVWRKSLLLGLVAAVALALAGRAVGLP